MKCTGNDPHFQLRLAKPAPAGRYKLLLQINSSAKGAVQIFWQELRVRPAFHRSRRVTFQPKHNGKPQEYSIVISPAKPVTAIRIDPAQSTGDVVITGIKLVDPKGRVVQRWLASE